MNDLTQIVGEWLQNQKGFNNFFISRSSKTQLWQYDQLMYMKRLKCEVITDVNAFITARVPACDLYMVGFIEDIKVAPWYEGWYPIKAHDPKFFTKLRRFFNHIENLPQKSYFIRRFYGSTKDIKKGYYNGLWH